MYICAILLSSQVLGAEVPINLISIEIGTQRVLQGKVNVNAHLSRKGVVDIVHIGNGRWNVVGLKTGYVILDIGHRYYIEVVSKRTASKTKRYDGKESCKILQVSCQGDVVYVDSWLLFKKIRTNCQQYGLCGNKILMSETLKSRINYEIEKMFGDSAKISFSPLGQSVLNISCRGKAHVKAMRELLDSYLGANWGTLICTNQLMVEAMQIAFRVYLVDEEQDKQWGFKGETKLGYSTKGGPELQLLSFLNTKVSGKGGNVLATPSIKISLSEEVSLQSGGEFMIRSHKENGEDAIDWKKHGIKITAKVFPNFSKSYFLDYSLEMLQPTNGLNSLATSKFKSKIPLKLGLPTLIGSSKIIRSNSGRHSWNFLSRIPIIGVLFRTKESLKKNTKIWVWAVVSHFDSDVSQLFHPNDLKDKLSQQ